ncbi:hypothetical protein ACNJYD_09810 [Bradyrhizobium sp. DASA03005]|uniref:hypothetical protein n=1 Tax=Bradyrhizobium sp. SPXBL-02 TaxID=3395912 RepID=UPI003F726818
MVRTLEFRNLSFLGSDQMDNLLRDHTGRESKCEPVLTFVTADIIEERTPAAAAIEQRRLFAPWSIELELFLARIRLAAGEISLGMF